MLSSVFDAMTNILADFVRFRIQFRTKSAKIFVIASKTLDSMVKLKMPALAHRSSTNRAAGCIPPAADCAVR